MDTNPIENAKFSYEFQKFVYQEPHVRRVDIYHLPIKPFSLDPSEKTKKDVKKQKKEPKKKTK